MLFPKPGLGKNESGHGAGAAGGLGRMQKQLAQRTANTQPGRRGNAYHESLKGKKGESHGEERRRREFAGGREEEKQKARKREEKIIPEKRGGPECLLLNGFST